jgi:hypothetical protein
MAAVVVPITLVRDARSNLVESFTGAEAAAGSIRP